MASNQPTDQELVRRAAAGSGRAYRELLARYQGPVFSLVYRLVRNRETAEDLAQETFVRVFNSIGRYDPKYKFSSWIFKIANNLAIDQLRKRELDTVSLHGSPHTAGGEQQAGQITAVSADETPAERLEARELGASLERAIGALRPEYRSAVTLRHVQGYGYEEISEIMEIPLGTVKTYIFRARAELREALAGVREEMN
ncbi:MAG: RNA polymerase sigma factor [Longimicrobiaceae bacterium]